MATLGVGIVSGCGAAGSSLAPPPHFGLHALELGGALPPYSPPLVPRKTAAARAPPTQGARRKSSQEPAEGPPRAAEKPAVAQLAMLMPRVTAGLKEPWSKPPQARGPR